MPSPNSHSTLDPTRGGPRGSAPLPVLFCIDIEPDQRNVCDSVDWHGFEATFQYLQALRPRLSEASGIAARYAWFLRMDPQVAIAYGSPDWAARRYARELDLLQAAGDEMGLHPHAWRWDDSWSTWVTDHADQAWVETCVRMSFETYERVFNRGCRAFRFGDHWMNDATLALVESLGADADLTLEPGQTAAHSIEEPHTGGFPDYTRVPQRPFHPSASDFRRPGRGDRRRIWEIPVSAGSTWPILDPDRKVARVFGGYERSTDPYQTFNLATGAPAFTRAVDCARGIARRFGRYVDRYVTLNLATTHSLFAQALDGLLAVKRVPYLALVARTDASIVAGQRRDMEQNVGYLLAHPVLNRCVFQTPAELVAQLDGGDQARWGRTVTGIGADSRSGTCSSAVAEPNPASTIRSAS